MTAQDSPRLRFVSLGDLALPPAGLCWHYKDQWWAVDPQRGLIFWQQRNSMWRSPQCNRQEAATRKLVAKFYPWAEVRFFESIIVKHYLDG